MNQETQQQAVLKLVLVSGVACAAWLFLVKPAFQTLQDDRITMESHKNLIATYQAKVGDFDSTESVQIQAQLEEILNSMSGSASHGDSGTALHSLINGSAAKYGVSVSRIESINSRQLDQEIEGVDAKVEGISHIVRVEAEGDYGSVMTFMGDIVSSPVQVKFTSFRFMPIGHETVRMNAEISSVVLTSVPSGHDQGGAINE